MKKFFFLGIGLLFHFSSCDLFTSKKKVIELIQEKNIDFNISNKDIKVFFALDTECPLSKQYTKKINQLAKKYSKNVEFLIFFPGPYYSKEEVEKLKGTYKPTKET